MRSVIVIFGISLLTAPPAFAQGTFPPSSFKNLQVLPKDAPARDVIGTMKGFANGLGVRCQFCHVGKEGMPLEQFDFVSDDVPQKKTARIMMRIAAEVNQQLDAAVPRAAAGDARVTCLTCHRGKSTPDSAKVP